jgi:hypothetical protein
VWITAGLQNETYVIHFSNERYYLLNLFVVLTRTEKRGIHGISVKIVVDLFSFFFVRFSRTDEPEKWLSRAKKSPTFTFVFQYGVHHVWPARDIRFK